MKLERSFNGRTIYHRSDFRLALIALFLVVPLAAHAQGTPLDTGFTNLQNLFTGTIAKVGSLIAISLHMVNLARNELWPASLPVL
jgi:type IV secretory pathway VirB2 component (pilin)